MNVQNRLLRVVNCPTHEVLVASDVRGRVHKFDYDLNLIHSSPVVTYDRPVNAICATDHYVFTRDRFGAIGKWDLATLMPLDFYDGQWICDPSTLEPNETPSPTPNRAMAFLNGRLYTCNAYNQFVVLDADTFAIIDIRPSPSPTFVDCICVDDPQVHAMSDVAGRLFIGNLETGKFPVQATVDTSVVHGVVYDRRHDRFWTTQDGGLGADRCVRTGVTVIEKDGTGFTEFKLSHEDNEFIAFDPDHRWLFVGGFNGKIAVFDNEKPEFCLAKLIGPLKFQVIHAAVVNADQIYALLQTGDLVRLNSAGEEVAKTSYRNRCVWTLEQHPACRSVLYAGTDHGVTVLRYGSGPYDSIQLEQLASHHHGFGIVKDLKVFDNGSYVGISRKGDVFKASRSGAIEWQRQVPGIPRGIAVNDDSSRCLVATDVGKVWELTTLDGGELDVIPVGSPSYACLYTHDGRRAVTTDAGQQVCVYAAESHELLGSIGGFGHRLKRMFRLANDEVFVAGPAGIFELDLDNFACRRAFGQYMVSTKENAVLCDGFLHAGGYGYQVASYRYDDGQIVSLHEKLPDYTKAFAAGADESGSPILLVGGRGGFICAFRVYHGVPRLLREWYIR